MTERSDILVAGAGAAGLTLGIALAEAGFEVTIAGRLDLRRNGRTVALFEASLRFYRALGLWERLASEAAPLAITRIIDDTGSAFHPPPAEFHAAEIDLPALGQNIENADLVTELAAAARRTPGLRLIEGFFTDYAFRPESVAAIARRRTTVRSSPDRRRRRPRVAAAHRRRYRRARMDLSTGGADRDSLACRAPPRYVDGIPYARGALYAGAASPAYGSSASLEPRLADEPARRGTPARTR